jgi:carboxymethylenebutenolidase
MQRAGSELALAAAARPGRAYCAEPASGRGRGVLVVHEAEGLGEFARDVCDRLAREGFVALAPDWLGGAAPAEAARRGAEAPDPERAGAALDAGVQALFSREACEGARIGALGFGLGGSLALALAARNRRVGAVVSCWGAHPRLEPGAAELTAACLLIVGERDAGAPAAAAFEGRLRAAGRRSALRTLPGVAAGFLDMGRHAAFDAAAAVAAWDALLAFLRAELA